MQGPPSIAAVRSGECVALIIILNILEDDPVHLRFRRGPLTRLLRLRRALMLKHRTQQDAPRQADGVPEPIVAYLEVYRVLPESVYQRGVFQEGLRRQL